MVPFGAVLKRGPDAASIDQKDYGTGTPIVRIDSFASGDLFLRVDTSAFGSVPMMSCAFGCQNRRSSSIGLTA